MEEKQEKGRKRGEEERREEERAHARKSICARLKEAEERGEEGKEEKGDTETRPRSKSSSGGAFRSVRIKALADVFAERP